MIILIYGRLNLNKFYRYYVSAVLEIFCHSCKKKLFNFKRKHGNGNFSTLKLFISICHLQKKNIQREILTSKLINEES